MTDYRHIARLLAAIHQAYQAGIYTLAQLYLCYAAVLRQGKAMPEIRTIELSPPQACGILDPAKGGRICGKPARYATAEAAPVRVGGPAGYLLVLPICDSCARYVSPAIADRVANPPLVVHTTLALPPDPAPAVLVAAANLLDDQAQRMRRDAKILRERAGELVRRN
jgi:hypothetical protein